MTPDMDSTMVGHVLLFCTAVLGQYMQWKREARHHRWQMEAMQQLSKDVNTNGHGGPP